MNTEVFTELCIGDERDVGGKLLRQKAPQQAMALSSHQLGSWSGGEGEREGGGRGDSRQSWQKLFTLPSDSVQEHLGRSKCYFMLGCLSQQLKVKRDEGHLDSETTVAECGR